jgi:hypothetical protein
MNSDRSIGAVLNIDDDMVYTPSRTNELNYVYKFTENPQLL